MRCHLNDQTYFKVFINGLHINGIHINGLHINILRRSNYSNNSKDNVQNIFKRF